MFKKQLPLYQKPQINIAQPTAVRMWLVSLCAGLAIFQSSLTDSFASLVIAVTAVIAAILTEALIYFRTENAGMIKDGSAVTSALVLVLLLPNQLHPIYVAMGVVFAMTVVKHSFGGLGTNWLNPAVGGWLFIRFSWPQVFHKALETSPLTALSEGIARGLSDPDGSPLGIINLAGAAYFGTGAGLAESRVGSFISTILSSIPQVELPREYIEFFSASAPGIIADRGILALLLGTVIITASQINRAWIPAVYLGVYVLLIRLFGAIPFGGSFGQGDIFFGLFSGGTLAAGFLLVSDPVTGPKSNRGALALLGIGGGLLTFLFRYQGLEAYSAFFAIALLNTLVPLIRDFESQRLYLL
jgi:electron transport complex protein RnfD